MTIGTDLRLFRAAAGLSQADVARAAGWSQSRISRIESGKRLPTELEVEVLSKVFASHPAAGAIGFTKGS